MLLVPKTPTFPPHYAPQPFALLIVDLDRQIVSRSAGAVPAIPSFVAAEVVSNSGCERAVVISCGVLGVSGSSYVCELQSGHWQTSVLAGIGVAGTDGSGVYVGSPVVSVISHLPLAASPPSVASLVQPRSMPCRSTELSSLACDSNAGRSTLVRSILGIQVCMKLILLI